MGWTLAHGGTNAKRYTVWNPFLHRSRVLPGCIRMHTAPLKSLTDHSPRPVRLSSSPRLLPRGSCATGGLTDNDFIVAAKVNELKLSDLLPKRKARYWA